MQHSLVFGALDPQRPALHMAASSARGAAAKKRKEVIQMGKIKGYVEYEDNRIDFDGSDAVMVVVIRGEDMIVSIKGELSGIGRYIAMMADADMISKKMKQTLKNAEELDKN